jgi:hypothetical protein
VFIKPCIRTFQAGRLVFVEVAVIAADPGLGDNPRQRTMVISIASNNESDEHADKVRADDFSVKRVSGWKTGLSETTVMVLPRFRTRL